VQVLADVPVGPIIGAAILEQPAGSPRLRSVILVAPLPASSQVYVVSIGNGPSAVLITSRSPGTTPGSRTCTRGCARESSQ
jgi:hypothetical protein